MGFPLYEMNSSLTLYFKNTIELSFGIASPAIFPGGRGKQCGVNMSAVLKTLTFPREPFPLPMIIIIVSIFLITPVQCARETIDGPNSTKSYKLRTTTRY